MPKANQSPQNPTILSYAKDLPNILSLLGLACTVLAIYFGITSQYPFVMIALVWAVAFDWADGLVARKLKGRTPTDAKFGGQLDVLIDTISYGVAPAILLLSYGKFEPIFLIGAFVMLAAAVLRLSYFSVYGLSGGAKYTGLALDNNSLILVFIFLFERFFSNEVFVIVLYASMMIIAGLNVSEIKTPKLSGNPRNVYLLGGYVVFVSLFYGVV